jgi:DNA-binding transcriptional LysR family regulator
MARANRGNVDLKLLQCFQALLTEQNVGRAARVVGIAQPSMSHALNRLRLLFDDPLFVNVHGVMAPTARAQSLAGRLNDVLVSTELLLSSADTFDPRTAVLDLTIMAAEYVEYVLLPPLLKAIGEVAPGVRLNFETANRERALELMERGEIDFRFAWWTEPAPALRFKTLFSDHFVCVARAGHPAVHDGHIAEQAFLDGRHAVVQRTRSGLTYQALEFAFTQRSRVRNVAVHVQDALSLCNVVSQSDLLAALPERFAARLAPLFGLQVASLPLEVGMARQSMYWHERTHKLPSHRWFRDLVAGVADRL